MGIRTMQVATCDFCKELIQEGEIWIDYGYAGIALHWHKCVLSMTAAQFIEVVHECGDQMFVKDSIENNSYQVELKHLSWRTDPRNMANAIEAAKASGL